MSRFRDSEDPRRRLLLQALAAGFFSGGVIDPVIAQIFGDRPAKLPAGRSIYRVTGQATVDGKVATVDTKILGGATLETGRNSELVYAVGDSAFVMRGESKVIFQAAQPDSTILSGLRMLSGRLLSVFASGRPLQLQTKTATIGIRGTGVYLEADPEQTYFCTCYGVADVQANDDPQSKDTVAAKHHEKPLYILSGASAGKNIRNAPFVNHTDQELMMIETLVGRQPPFIFPKADYTGPRRSY
jgi:FecR protein